MAAKTKTKTQVRVDVRLHPFVLVWLCVCLLSCSWVSLSAASSVCTSSNSQLVNFRLQIPLGFFGAFGSAVTQAANSTVYGYSLAHLAMLQVLQANNLAKTPLNYNIPPLYDQTIEYVANGDWCFQVNLFVQYQQVTFDYNSDYDMRTNTLQSIAACQTTNSQQPNPPVISVIHSSFNANTGSNLYSSTATTCNAEGVSTIAAFISDPQFSNKNFFPYSARTVLLSTDVVPAVFSMLQEFGWTRLAILSTSEPANQLIAQAILQGATAQGVSTIAFNVLADTSCEAALNAIQAQQYKIVFFNTAGNEIGQCLNSLYARGMLAQNYIPIFSAAVMSTLLSNIANVQTYINFTASALSGSLGQRIISSSNAIVSAQFSPILTALWQQYGVNTKYATSGQLILPRGASLQSQGVLGMVGTMFSNARQSIASHIGGGNGNVSALPPLASIQQFVQDFLSNFSMNGRVDLSQIQLNASSGAGSAVDVLVPYQSVQYNTSNVFYWFTNASSAYSSSAYFDHNYYTDNNGDMISPFLAFNVNGTTQVPISIYNPLYASYTQYPNVQFTWPNSAILSQYANAIPADRAPPTQMSLSCTSCISQSSGNANPITNTATINTFFTAVPNLLSTYEIDLTVDLPTVYQLQTSCDGTAPFVFSMWPTIPQLLSQVSSTTTVAPAAITFTASTGTIQISSFQVYSVLSALYAANPTAFQSADAMQPLSFSALTSLPNTASSAHSVIGTADGSTNAFVVSFVLNCNNGANNVSSILTVRTLSEADVYTPASTAQVALITLNAIGLSAVCVLSVLVFRHRYHTVIFSSSQSFLYVILSGFCLLYVSALLSILTATTSVCRAKLISFHLGFTLALGAIFIKTYRLHRIFNSKKLINISITTSSLLLGLLVLLCVDAIVLISWIQASGVDIESSSKPHCYTAGTANVFFPAIFTGLKGLVILLGVYLTLKVRSLPANFNESRYIAIVIYNSCVLTLLYVVVFFVTSLQPNQLSIFTSVLLFFGATVNLLVFFVPKLLAIGPEVFRWNESSSAFRLSAILTNKRSSFGKQNQAGKSAILQSRLDSPYGINSPSAAAAAAAAGAAAGTGNDITLSIGNSNSNSNVSGGSKDAQEDSLLYGLVQLKKEFLNQVAKNKNREGELRRLDGRRNEVENLLNESTDDLRALVLNIRIVLQKFSRHSDKHLKKESTGGGSTDKTNGTGSGSGLGNSSPADVLLELERLIDTPLDAIPTDSSSTRMNNHVDGGANRQSVNARSILLPATNRSSISFTNTSEAAAAAGMTAALNRATQAASGPGNGQTFNVGVTQSDPKPTPMDDTPSTADFVETKTNSTAV